MNYSAILPPCRNRTQIPAPGTVLYYFAHITPIVLAVGIVGNILNLAVLGGTRSRTNVFLSCMAFADLCFLGAMTWLNLSSFDSLAMSDEFQAIFVPTKLPVTMMANWFSGCSTWFAVMVTLERLIAVRNPLNVSQYFNRWTVSGSIVLIMVMVMVSYLHYLFWMYPLPVPMCGDPRQRVYVFVAFLRFRNPTRYDYVHVSTALSGVLCVVVPIVLLVTFNAVLICSLYRSRQALASLGQSSRTDQELKVTVTVITITVTAVVLLTPSVGLAIWDTTDFGPLRRVPRWYFDFSFFCNLLVVCDRTSNFLLYCLSSQAFRRKLFAMLSSTGRSKRSDRGRSQSSTMITQDSVRRRSVTQVQKVNVNGKMTLETVELIPKGGGRFDTSPIIYTNEEMRFDGLARRPKD